MAIRSRTPILQSLATAVEDLPVFFAAVVSFAFILRMIVVALVVPEVSAVTFDHNAFGWEMGWTARSIFLGQGFSSPFLPVTGPTALVPPIYPYLLAAMFRLFGLYTPAAAAAVLGFNSLCSALTCIPLFFLVRNSLNARVARITVIAWAIYPFAVYFSADRVWDYALTALLFTTCLLIAQKLHLRGYVAWAGFGALYAIAVLCNPSILTMLPLLLLIAMYKVWRVDGAWKRKGILAAVTFFAVCTPWNLRNHHALHNSFFIRDGFWIEFYAGNNGDETESNSAWAHPASNAAEMQTYQTLGETAYIAQKHQLAVAFLAHHHVQFIRSTIHRIVRFWTGYWSFSASYLKYEPLDVPNFPFCLFLVWALLRGLRRFWHESPTATMPYLLAILVFPLPYYLTHSSMDYRQPLEPVIIVLVTVGLFGTRDQPPAARNRRPRGRISPALA